ncbi:MAG: hypothetical protein ACE366_20080 [Bradymonadia bacterium]
MSWLSGLWRIICRIINPQWVTFGALSTFEGGQPNLPAPPTTQPERRQHGRVRIVAFPGRPTLD